MSQNAMHLQTSHNPLWDTWLDFHTPRGFLSPPPEGLKTQEWEEQFKIPCPSSSSQVGGGCCMWLCMRVSGRQGKLARAQPPWSPPWNPADTGLEVAARSVPRKAPGWEPSLDLWTPPLPKAPPRFKDLSNSLKRWRRSGRACTPMSRADYTLIPPQRRRMAWWGRGLYWDISGGHVGGWIPGNNRQWDQLVVTLRNNT